MIENRRKIEDIRRKDSGSISRKVFGYGDFKLKQSRDVKNRKHIGEIRARKNRASNFQFSIFNFKTIFNGKIVKFKNLTKILLNRNFLKKAVALAVIVSVAGIAYFQNLQNAQSATYTWTQTGWDANATPGSTITHPVAGQTTYESKDSGIDASAGTEIDLNLNSGSVTHTSNTDFGGTKSSVVVEGTGSAAALKLDDGYVYPAGVSQEVSTIQQADCGSAQFCYNSLSAWENDKDGNITASGRNVIAVAKITGSWTSPDNIARVDLNNWTTDPTHFVRIYTDATARHSGKWDDTKYRLEITNDNNIYAPLSHVRIEGLQIKNSITNGGAYRGILIYSPGSANSDIRISDNIIKFGTGSAGCSPTGITVNGANANVKIWNNIIYDFNYSGDGTGINNYVSLSAYVYGNTLYGNRTGLASSSSTGLARNNIAYSNTTNYSGTFSSSSSYNLSGPSPKGGAPGTNGRNSKTVVFADEAGDDFRLASNDNDGAKNYGTDLSSDPSLAFNTDIEGHLRPPASVENWDIGADEYETIGNSTIYTGTFTSAGTYTSGSVNAGQGVAWGNLNWTGSSAGTLIVKVRTDNNGTFDEVGEPAWGSCSSISNGAAISTGGCATAGHQYAQYQVSFSTTDSYITPFLSDITLNYDYYPITSQTLISSAYDSSQAANVIGGLSWTEDTSLPVGTTVTVSLETAATQGGLTGTWTNFTNACGKVGGVVTCDSSAIPAGMKDGSGDQWFRYKITLTSTGVNTPTVSDVSTTYVVNAAPSFDATYGTNGIVVAQVSNSADANWGKTKIQYAIKDSDTSSGNITQYYVTPTFQYSTNGTIWNDVNLANITFGTAPINGDITDRNSDGKYDNKVLEGSYLAYTAYWDAKTQLGESYSASYQIKVTINDNEAANNTTPAQSAAFTLDTTNPASNSVVVNASTIPAAISLASTDNSSLQMKVGLAADLAGSAWETYSTSKTLALATDPDIVYAQFRDAFGNVSSIISATTPETPTQVMIQDTSNMNSTPPEYRLFTAWQAIALPTPGFGQYNILRSTNIDTGYASIGTSASRTTNYYGDSTVAYDTNYYYKISSQDSSGNISYLSSSINGRANGTQDAGEGTISIAPLSAITDIIASLVTDEKAVITFSTDQAALCTVNYGTNTGNYTEVPIEETQYDFSHSITLSSTNGLIFSTKYYYQIDCEDDAEITNSASSAEYNFTTLEKQYDEEGWGDLADSTAPSISGVSAGTITGESATITWSTNEIGNSSVVYGVVSGAYGNGANDYEVNSDKANYVKAHTVVINGLVPGTKYYYKAMSTDTSGNIGESSENSFTTKSTASLSGVKPVSTKLGEATITWKSSKKTTSIVEYGETEAYGESKESTAMVLEHEITLSNLKQNIEYYFMVKGKDADNNWYSSQGKFTPKSPPQIQNIQIDSVEEHNVKIKFTTNVPTDAILTYEDPKDDKNSGSQGNPQMTTDHEVELKNLKEGTAYTLKIKVRDADGNETEQLAQEFTTGKDENPPKIDQIRTDSALAQGDKVQTIISWATDEPATTALVYKEGKNGSENEAKINDNATASHVAVITVFKPGTVYYFKAKSIDQSGNIALSTEYALLTPRKKENIIQIIVNNFQDIFKWAKF